MARRPRSVLGETSCWFVVASLLLLLICANFLACLAYYPVSRHCLVQHRTLPMVDRTLEGMVVLIAGGAQNLCWRSARLSTTPCSISTRRVPFSSSRKP